MTITAPCPTLGGVQGPLLVVGCEDGAVLRTAVDAGLQVVGVDDDPQVVEACTTAGLPAIRQSLSDPIPGEGTWRTVMLRGGVVRAGDDVEAALARSFALLEPGGLLIVEAVASIGADGVRGASDSIPMLLRAADGFTLSRIREDGGQWFVGLRRPA